MASIAQSEDNTSVRSIDVFSDTDIPPVTNFLRWRVLALNKRVAALEAAEAAHKSQIERVRFHEENLLFLWDFFLVQFVKKKKLPSSSSFSLNLNFGMNLARRR